MGATFFAVAALVSTVASTAYSMYSNNEASKAAKKAAEEAGAIGDFNAKAIQEESAESVRRQTLMNQRQESQAMALAAASGVKVDSGSMSMYIKDMKKENVAELDWLRKSGTTQASLARLQGAQMKRVELNKASAYSRNVWGSAFSGASSLIGQGGSLAASGAFSSTKTTTPSSAWNTEFTYGK